jgi:hypothetical protein
VFLFANSSLPIGPISSYMLTHLLFIPIILFNLSERLRINDVIILILFIFFSMIIIFNIIDIKYIPLALNMLFYIYGRYVGSHTIASWVFMAILMQFVVEACVRYLYPDFSYYESVPDWPIWYAFKYSSFMYIDSNFTALHLGFLFIYLSAITSMSRLKSCLIWLLMLLTLSRAAIIGLVFTSSIARNWLITLFVCIFITAIVITFMGNDPSLKSKFQIIENMTQVAERSTYQNLAGSGFGYVNHVLEMAKIDYKGVAGHVHLFELFLWFGIIGGSLIIVLISSIYSVSFDKKNIGLLLAFFIVSGMSLGPLFFHPFWFFLGALSNRTLKSI